MERLRLWLYLGLSALVFAVGVWGLAAQSRVGALPPGALPSFEAGPIRIGVVRVASSREAAFVAERFPPGSSIDIEAGGVRRQVVATRAIGFGLIASSAACGFFFLAVATFVFAWRVRLVEAHLLYFASLLYGLTILIGGTYVPDAGGIGLLLPILRLAGLCLLPGLFVGVVLVFPRRFSVVDRIPVIPALFVFGSVCAVWWASAFLRYVAAPDPSAWSAMRAPVRLAQFYLIGCDAVGCLLLFRGSRRLELSRERQQAKWLLWGITLGVTPYAFLHVLPPLVGLPPVLPLALARLATIAIPIAFTFAVVRYQFLDIDIVIRRSVIYALLAGVIAGVYAFLVLLVGKGIRRLVPEHPEFVPILATAVSVALFGPTRRAIGRWVDRTFFKIQFDYDQALRALGRELERPATQQEIADAVRAFLRRTLDPEEADLVMRRDAEETVDAISAAAAREGGEPIVATPGGTAMPEIENPALASSLPGRGIRVALPLDVDGRALGALVLGARRSGRRYVEQDVEMLRRLAGIARGALERIGYVQQVVHAELETESLKALDRAKSDFLFRVAHDLRTPLTSISWSARNLMDGVAGPMAGRQLEYVGAIDASARQLARLVNNLLVISRLEQGSLPFPLAPTCLGTVTEEVVAGLRPIAEERAVRIDVRVQDGLPPARGNRERLAEALVNLTSNAVRYSPTGGTIEVVAEEDGRGWQRIVVRDAGPGVPPEDRGRIFERFQQGPPSPYVPAGGFGLGLFLVRSYLERMDGTVEVDDHPEGGARFTVRLPDWTEEGSATP